MTQDGVPARLFPIACRVGLLHHGDGILSMASLASALERAQSRIERDQRQERINHGNPAVRKRIEERIQLLEAAQSEIYGFLNPPTSWNDDPDAPLADYGLVRCRAADYIEVFTREAAFNRSNLCERHWQLAHGIDPDERWRYPTPQTPTTPEGSEHDAQ